MADEDNAYSFTTAATRKITLDNLGADGFRMWRGGGKTIGVVFVSHLSNRL